MKNVVWLMFHFYGVHAVVKYFQPTWWQCLTLECAQKHLLLEGDGQHTATEILSVSCFIAHIVQHILDLYMKVRHYSNVTALLEGPSRPQLPNKCYFICSFYVIQSRPFSGAQSQGGLR